MLEKVGSRDKIGDAENVRIKEGETEVEGVKEGDLDEVGDTDGDIVSVGTLKPPIFKVLAAVVTVINPRYPGRSQFVVDDAGLAQATAYTPS